MKTKYNKKNNILEMEKLVDEYYKCEDTINQILYSINLLVTNLLV